MANFALDVNTSEQELVSSINYLLSTVGSGQTANALVANTTTGTITNVTSGNIIGYLYQFINIRYADSADGGTNFSTSPTNRLYYGVRNSATSAASSNPADYIWFEVAAGGFGTTKFLFYTSIGGNQIQFFVGTAAPNLFYEQAIDNTPIDLSIITTSIPTTTINIFYPEGQFIVRANANVFTPPAIANVVTLVANVQALRQNQITAAVDQNIQYFTANGNYFITSNTSTAFNANLFSFGTPYSSTYNVYQDVVYSDVTGITNSFISAALIVNDSTANVGPPGQRGSIPLGFVTTVNDPNTATSANLTAQFQAARTNTTPPIGLGVGGPILGDTVQFFFPNLAAINGGITSVRTWDGNVWTPVTANVISGNVIYTGTITSQAMSTFDVFTLRIQSTNSEIGNVNAKGFWLDSVSGDARFAGNTYVGNNLVIGNNAQIGSNLNVGQNLVVGNNASIGANLTIGNNSVIGGNLSVQGLISQGSLANAVVTTASLQDGSITGIKIQTGTITGNLIEANTITGNLIAANTITGTNIVSNSIFGNAIVANTFQANTINGNAIVANSLIVSGDVRSDNATVGNVNSPGYWLQSSTGDARFGGNTYIGNNLTVANLITSGALNANVITTNQLQINASTQTVSIADNTNYPQITYVNGNATIGSANYLWPINTRGFAVGGGLTIVPTTNGSVSGSRIIVTYNAFISSSANVEYNCVELWKSGSSTGYRTTFYTARTYPPFINNPNSNTADMYYFTGDNGAFIIGNIGNLKTSAVTTSNTMFDAIYNASVYTDPIGGTDAFVSAIAYGQLGTVFFVGFYPPGMYSFDPTPVPLYQDPVTYNTSTVATIPSNSNVGSGLPLFTIYGATSLYSSTNFRLYNVLVGSSGYILTYQRKLNNSSGGQIDYYNFDSGSTAPFATFADLNDVCQNLQPNTKITLGSVTYCAVGTSGTILYNTREIPTNFGSWSQAVSNTIVKLNGVWCNYGLTTAGNTWCAVGDGGTILYASNPAGPWISSAVVPTTNNLQAVGWANGTWVAVGDNGTIITSANANVWVGPIVNPADGSNVTVGSRNLTGVAGGLYNGRWMISGQEIILVSSNTNPTTSTYSTAYLSGPSITSSLTRLQYYGSFANVADQSLPPINQRIVNNQIFGGTFIDTNYIEGQEQEYFLVVGNMRGNVNVFTNGSSIQATEYKR